MRSKTKKNTSRLTSDFAAFSGFVVCVVVGVWFLGVIVDAQAPVDTAVTPLQTVSPDVFPFSVDIVNALSGYYTAMDDASVDPSNQLDLFASVVYRRHLLEKINERMATYLGSEDVEVRAIAEHIVVAGRALETSYTQIIDAMKKKDQSETSLVVIEEMYRINDQLFDITITSANALTHFKDAENGATPQLSAAEQKFLNDHIVSTFGASAQNASSSPSRALILKALGVNN
jgi:hypothetical protein